jgi:DNA-binding HxlR family transcriptional regulator
MKKKQETAEDLYYKTIDLISKKWVLLILHVLAEKKCVRFSEITEMIPSINTKILSSRLSELEENNLLKRIVDSKKPVTVCYELTKKSKDLNKVFVPLIDWANTWSSGKKKIPKH